jgi:hypothetical protein
MFGEDCMRLAKLLLEARIAMEIRRRPGSQGPRFDELTTTGALEYLGFAQELISLGVRPPRPDGRPPANAGKRERTSVSLVTGDGFLPLG